MYGGWPRQASRRLVRGVRTLSKQRPVGAAIMYFDYYAAQVLRHYGGAEWTAWNLKSCGSSTDSARKPPTGTRRGVGTSKTSTATKGAALYNTAMAILIARGVLPPPADLRHGARWATDIDNPQLKSTCRRTTGGTMPGRLKRKLY
jgi:hypothetical protein